MKTLRFSRFTIQALLVGATCSAGAALHTFSWNSGFANSGVIPDGNTTGWSDTRSISVADTVIQDVNVTVNISGGYNGDLYGYLTHSSGFVVLLNRPGVTAGNAFGYADGGFNVKFNDQASTETDFHLYQTVSGWTISGSAQWRPDGRNIDPASSGATFDSATRQNSGNPLGLFNNLNPNGSWTLFFADLSAGGGQSTVVNWGLEIEAVPEPVHWALGIFAVLFGTGEWLRRQRRQRLDQAATEAKPDGAA